MTTAGLDTLREFFPGHPPSTLERYLTASNGNVERAIAAILQPNSLVTESRPRKRQRVQKLDSWLTSSAAQRNKDAPSASTAVAPIEAPKTPAVSAQLSPTISAFSLMKARPYIPDAPTPGPPNSLPTLRLTTPEQIQKHARGIITFIPNVLPTDLAARLFLRLVDESLPGENNPGCQLLDSTLRPQFYMLTAINRQGSVIGGSSLTDKSYRLTRLPFTLNLHQLWERQRMIKKG